jgi:hypothetical protein
VTRDYEGLLSDVVLPEALKTTAKANAVIAAAGDACVRGLVDSVQSSRLLRPIVEPLMDGRSNSKMRVSCSDYLVHVLQVNTRKPKPPIRNPELSKVEKDLGPRQEPKIECLHCEEKTWTLGSTNREFLSGAGKCGNN